MCHIFLAGYEDVPSFLNQWKLNRTGPQMITEMKPYLVYIYNSKLIKLFHRSKQLVYRMPMHAIYYMRHFQL
jgi:hypothetical protein